MNKRVFRDIKSNIGRYLALFILTVVALGMYVGFISGTDSAKTTFEKYLRDNNVEDGYVTLEGKIDNRIKKDVESLRIKFYNNYYVNHKSKDGSVVRIFDERTKCDLPYVKLGRLPKNSDDIFLDQNYASKKKLHLGDEITLADKKYKICGIGAFPDYAISLETATQMLADRSKFGVGMVSESVFNELDKNDIVYNYSFKYTKKYSDTEKKEKLRKMVKTLVCVSAIESYGKLDEAFEKMSNVREIKSYCGIDNNKRVSVVTQKMKSNKSMASMFVWVVIVIIAFLYVVFTKQTIQKECSVLGTLMALGIKKINILISYIIAPCVITFLGSLVGLLLGAKVLYLLPIHSLSGYYSIPDCKVNFDAAVILVAIFAPVILIAIINSLSILKALNRKPLQLIRHDLKKTRGMNKSHLNFGSFDFRFRLRVFASSMGAYVLLFIGIFLGGFLMMFGVGMSSSFDGYIEEQKNNSLCKYQYCVSDGYEIKNDAVEEATVGNFEYTDKKLKQTYSISGIGVIKNSDFFKKINRLTSDEIIISKDTAQKFVLKKDDVIKLENSATGQVDKYKIKDVVDYNLGLCFFTQQSEMNNILLKDVNYHNYYFSNKKIDIPKKYLVSKLSVEDYVSNGQVMKNAMKSMIMMFPTVAVIIYMIIMYILIKLVISQNEIGISMLKVFGFTESEIRKMYINTNTIITILFVLISLPLQYNFMVSIWPACIKTIPGYIGFVMEGKHLLIIALTGIVCYFIANVTSLNKVKKVPMVIALKNQDI